MTNTHPATDRGYASLARVADTVVLAALGVAAVAAMAIGVAYGQVLPALSWSAALFALGALSYGLWRGRMASRLLLALCLSAMVALHIQLARGTIEFHFGVFVTLALLLVYQDWRPIVASAAFFAVHHVLFDRLQFAGFEVYCITAPSLPTVMLHAAYVVAQTALEVFVATRMRAAALEGEELDRLVQAIDADGTVRLDLGGMAVSSVRAAGFQQVVARIEAAMRQVRAAAASVRAASTEIASGTGDLEHRTEQAAGSLQHTAQSVARLTDSARQSAESSRQANALAVSAAQTARHGSEAIAEVVATMGGISQSSKKITDIVGVIDSIAFQTNILALNAAVEAASAGEHGKGFAVVAAEVRNLARRSAEAAKEIRALIGASTANVHNGSQLVDGAGRTMQEIVVGIQRLSGIVATITAAASEQEQGMGHIHGAVDHLDTMLRQNVTLVAHSSAAAEDLRTQAQRLDTVLDGFHIGLENS